MVVDSIVVGQCLGDIAFVVFFCCLLPITAFQLLPLVLVDELPLVFVDGLPIGLVDALFSWSWALKQFIE